MTISYMTVIEATPAETMRQVTEARIDNLFRIYDEYQAKFNAGGISEEVRDYAQDKVMKKVAAITREQKS